MLNNNLLLKSITKENFKYDKGDYINNTFSFYISLPEIIQKHYDYLLQNDDGTVDEHSCIEYLFVEYRVDEGFYYMFIFGEDTVPVTEYFNCDYINNMVLDHFNAYLELVNLKRH